MYGKIFLKRQKTVGNELNVSRGEMTKELFDIAIANFIHKKGKIAKIDFMSFCVHS